MIGLENQSQAGRSDADADHRVRWRVLQEPAFREEGHQRYPVVTLVLYFGEKRWSGNRRSLWELFAEENNPAHKDGKPTTGRSAISRRITICGFSRSRIYRRGS